MGIKLSDIKTKDKKSFVKCKYVAKDGSVISKKYQNYNTHQAISNFKVFIDHNKLT
jgi:hypothetical protein